MRFLKILPPISTLMLPLSFTLSYLIPSFSKLLFALCFSFCVGLTSFVNPPSLFLGLMAHLILQYIRYISAGKPQFQLLTVCSTIIDDILKHLLQPQQIDKAIQSIQMLLLFKLFVYVVLMSTLRHQVLQYVQYCLL